MRLIRIFVVLLLLAGIHCSCHAAALDAVGAYTHPNLKVEWTVKIEADKVLLTGMILNTSRGEVENIELLARALFVDRSEMGRERFVFIPNTIRSGESAPFGMFFRIRNDEVPREIECTVYLERKGNTTGLEQEFFNFTAKVPRNGMMHGQ
jgi:hypothetical protein